MTTERAKDLVSKGHLAAAAQLLRTLVDDGCSQAQFELIEVLLQRQMPREAARCARALLEKDETDIRAQLRLCEALVMLGQGEQAMGVMPNRAHADETVRLSSAHARANLASLRQRGEYLWRMGAFEEGRDIYQELQAEEKNAQNKFRAILDVDPENAFAWNALVDAVGNYHLSAILSEAMPDVSNLRQAFIEAVTGRFDHAVEKYRNVTVSTFRSLSDWPHKDEVVAALPSNPRMCLPSVYGKEMSQAIPAKLASREMVKLKEAIVYDAGMHLWLRSARGDAPWLHEGMWKEYVGPYMPNNLALPHLFLEGNGTCLSVLPTQTNKIEQPVVVLGYWNNYGHVLHDIIPQLEDAESVLGNNFHILAVDSLLPSIREIFARAGYGADRIVTIGEGRTALLREAYCLAPRTQFQNLRYFKTYLSPDFRHYDMSLDDAGIDFVRRRLMKDEVGNAGKAWRKVYASRRHTARHPDNEGQIEAVLKAQGFEILVPEDLSFPAQIRLFAETKILISLEGAALANAMFMPKGGTVISLRSMAWGWSVNCFDELARIGSLRFGTIDFEGRVVPLNKLQEGLNALCPEC